MRSEWISRGPICHSLRPSFHFSPSTQGQLPTSCNLICVTSETVFHPSYSHVTRTDCHPCAQLLKKNGGTNERVHPNKQVRHSASQADYAMCVASVTMWAIMTAARMGLSTLITLCVSRLKEQRKAARSPNAKGERRLARPGCGCERGGTDRPLPESALHCATVRKKGSASHSSLSHPPCIQVHHCQMRRSMCRGL